MDKIRAWLTSQNQVINSLSPTLRFVFLFLFAVFFASTFVMLGKINNTFLIEEPRLGGELHEGIIDSPRFINPVLAFSGADKDLSALVFSGLLRKTSTGDFIPDLAESFEVSADNLKYTIKLKDSAVFHDGKKVTADDIIFTIKLIQDLILKSPQKIRWEGVAVEKIDDSTLTLTLRQPYAFFLENLTTGILPAHRFKNVPIEQISFHPFNLEAVGSGPFRIKEIKKRSDGTISHIELVSFRNFALGRPYISNFFLHFYSNEKTLLDALKRGEVSQVVGLSGTTAAENNFRIETFILPRIFGLFPNQNQATIFTDKSVIEAFDLAINKAKIVSGVLQGFGNPIDSAVPESIIEARDTYSKEKALEILTRAGWVTNEDGVREKKGKTAKDTARLAFAIATADTPDLKQTAELIKEDLSKIGAEVSLNIFEIGDLNQNIIRPRKYDLLLFGQVINNDGDLFSFWHSSQRKDPGLNIANYTSAKSDKLLEEMLSTGDEKERANKIAGFEEEIKKDKAAVFLYSPKFIYIVDKNIKGISLPEIGNGPDRFSESYKWFLETEKIWSVFAK
ncbi:MAG TPA: ABC transporter substrate-binding protein [Candidatus Paceibacterota bacterium]|nr:ABC transporter substrate-binding protein [Candidatus Paceibacterota bacterium]